jgi:outer membrane protein TolC
MVGLPIFDAGRRAGNCKPAKAQCQLLLVNYERAISNAFREVAGSLLGCQ